MGMKMFLRPWTKYLREGASECNAWIRQCIWLLHASDVCTAPIRHAPLL